MNERRRPTGTPSSGQDDELFETLRLAQRFGVLGARPVEEAVAHARQFVAALEPVHGRVIDLGSGGGLPGLVIAVDRPDLEVILVDRREKRTDLLERAVARLGLGDRVTVRCEDATRLRGSIPDGAQAVTARGFGPPEHTLRVAASCRAPDGRIVISEPPSGDRWDAELVSSLGLRLAKGDGVAVFTGS